MALVVSTLVFVRGSPAGGAVINPFAVRFQTTDNGAIRLFGNTVLTCPPSATNCASGRSGTGSSQNNNNFTMQYVDADGPAFPTVNSSRSLVVLPEGSSVIWAGLYWGARLTAGSGGSAAPTAGRNQMKLRPPGAPGYTTITGTTLFGPSSGPQAYQRFAEVTGIVRAAGPGDYWGADIAAATGEDRYGGWSLAVVFRNPTMPLRNLTVFDGFAEVGQNESATVTISGFLAPQSGPVETQLGMVAYEGDRGTTGDRATVLAPPNPDTQLASTLSLGTNFFNSSYDINGVSITTRTPGDLNMLGFDLKNIGAPGAIPNGATTAQIRFSSTGDVYFPGVLTTIIDVFSPDFTSSTKTAVDLAGNDPAAPGDEVQYTLNYVNTGDDPADSAVTTDPVPAGTTYVPGSMERFVDPDWVPVSDAAGDDVGEFLAGAGPRGSVRARLGAGAGATAEGTIADGGGTASVRFRVTVDPDAAGTTLTNEASLAYVTATTGDDLTYMTVPTRTPVQATADLAVTKVTTPDPAAAGGEVISRIDVTNAGPNPAADVVVTDELPAGASLVSATPSQGSCTSAGGGVTCALGEVAVGAQPTLTVVTRTDPGEQATSLTNQVAVSSTTADPDETDNSATATVALRPEADLRVDKTGPGGPVAPGETLPFTVRVTNAGPSPASAVRLGDLAGPGLSLLPGPAPCPSFPCTLGDLAPGASVDVAVTAQVAPDFTDTQVANTAAVTSPTFDPDPAARVDTATVPVGPPQANVSVDKVALVGTAVAGAHVPYRLFVTNHGPSDATAVTVTDLLGPGVTADAAATTRGTCTTGATLSCDLGDIPAGAGASILLTADFGPGVAPGPFANRATVSATTADPVPADDTGSARIDVVAAADLVVSKAGTPNPVAPDAPVTYTVTVANQGPSTAQAVTLADVLPVADFAFVSATASQGTCTPPAGADLGCALGAVAPGDEVTVTVVMDVPADFAGGDVTNSATVTSTTTELRPADNAASFTSSSQPQADLSLDKSASPDPVTAGEAVTYTLTVTNHGPFAATGVAVDDVIPPGLSSVAASGPGFTCGTGAPIHCTLPTLAAGGSAAVTVTATADAGLAFGSTLANAATVGSAVPDPTGSNNAARVESQVDTRPDLVTTKTLVPPASHAAGGLLTFDITVTNTGPSLARSVAVLDEAPDIDMNVIDIHDNQGEVACAIAGGALSCPLGNLAPGASHTITIDAVSGPDQPFGTFTNSATASTTTPEPDLSDNQAVAPFTIDETEADVIVTKQGPAQADAGGPFRYELDVTNGLPTPTFPSTASGVVVVDTLPDGMVPAQAQSTQGTCTIAGQTVTCTLGDLAPWYLTASVAITITGTIDPSLAPETVANAATATTSTPDVEPASNTASVSTAITRSADLSVTKTPDAAPVLAGSTVTYAVTVTNAGPSTASPVVVTDPLPTAMAFDPAASDPRCTQPAAGTPVTCTIPAIPPGDSVVLGVAGRLDPAFTGATVDNTVAVDSPTPDPDATNDHATVTTGVDRVADLALTKVAESPTPAAGDPDGERYDITLRNNGPSDATDVVLSDEIPPGTTLVGPVEAQPDLPGGCTVMAATISCPIGTLPAGASQSLTVTVRIPASFAPGPLANTATATSSTGDPAPPPVTAEATVDVTVVADLEVLKTLRTDPIVAGQPVTYDIAVTNHGPSDAPDVLISDTLPAGSGLLAAVPQPGGTCTPVVEDGLTIVGCRGPELPVGTTAVGSLTISTPPDLQGDLANTVFVGSGALDDQTLRAGSANESTATGPVTVQLDAAVAAVADIATVAPGGRAAFTVTVSNGGPSVAHGVELVNHLPAGLADPAAADVAPTVAPARAPAAVELQQAAGCTASGGTATCPLGDLAPGDAVTLRFSGRVPADAADGVVLVDDAAITATGDTGPTNDTASAQTTVVRPAQAPPTAGPTVPALPAPPIASAPGTPSGPGRGTLPVTGAALAGLVALGVTCLLVGHVLRRGRSHSRPRGAAPGSET
jgi:uncharacterized repeat protein (TIGR01451 family)